MTKDFDMLQGGFEALLDDRDYLFRLLNEIDWDAQLEAIRQVFLRNKAAAKAVSSNINVLEEKARTYRGPYQDQIVDQHVDSMFRSAYSDAANSLSAVGMIVPMMESIFSQSFHSLGLMYTNKKMNPPDHPRWQRADSHPERWNCQWYFGDAMPRVDIISGVAQLSGATNLTACLEPGTIDWIQAMLTYRNRMFHGGFEWSLKQREQFQNQIVEKDWDKYFQSARTDDKPWIFYLRDDVIDDMPRRMEGILDGFGKFAKNLPFELVALD